MREEKVKKQKREETPRARLRSDLDRLSTARVGCSL